MANNRMTVIAVMMMLALTMTGCEEDERVTQLAREAADRQAAQNEQMARVTQEVAEGSRKLVEADAQARKEIVEVHKDLQSERATLGNQWNQLEAERQQMAQDRRTESLLVPAVEAMGVIAVAVLAIGFCVFLLFGLRKTDPSDVQLGELLVHELVSDEPRLLPLRDPPLLPMAGTNRADRDKWNVAEEDNEPKVSGP